MKPLSFSTTHLRQNWSVPRDLATSLLINHWNRSEELHFMGRHRRQSIVTRDRTTPRNKQEHSKAGKSTTKTATGGSSYLVDRHLHDPSSTALSSSSLTNQWPGPASACAGSRPCHRGTEALNFWMSWTAHRWLGGNGNKRHDRNAYIRHHKALINPVSTFSLL